ncbi:hypothetical protein N431DRAFT_351537 [Stipitochalara longipes BDJ]|nr:hypothetical protein N431DRAFT_351537 [Stipitochalara longipes BDJ]
MDGLDRAGSSQERQSSRAPIDRQIETGVPRLVKKRARIHTACERCKTRKIKARYPACSNCRTAGTACVKESSHAVQQHETSRALQDRVRWLEEIVKTRASDVDLTQGPRILINPEASAHDGISVNRVPATPQLQQASTVGEPLRDNLAHEIGLVSVTAGQDPRYVGPSSGYSFAKLVLASAGQQQRQQDPPHRELSFQTTSPLDKDIFRIPPAKLPANMEHSIQLSAGYWEDIHFQYPFLHQPTHTKLVEHMHSSEAPSPVAAFQFYMVLAISTTVLSRRLKVPLLAEGYCTSAMSFFEQIQIEGSLEGLQCLLLLQIYALNNPSIGVNVWYLNYQCIASMLDLGLQRDVRAGKSLSMLTQEMRTRIFWVVYSLDRTLATIMGRPIGLRDEACELRLPQDIDDDALTALEPRQRLENYTPSNITLSIHLIKLAQLNSEIKYIANSISRKAPPHSYPQVPDVLAWKDDVLRRLRRWREEIPQNHGTQPNITKMVEIKYHEVLMLLLRPSPAIAFPSNESLKLCQNSALAVIRNFDELYHENLLPYTWVTVHSVFLGTITMLYCIWNVPSMARTTKLETLMGDLKSASSILSALGEHWFSAKRSRELLDELSTTTIRWLIGLELKQSASSVHMDSEAQDAHAPRIQQTALEANNGSIGDQTPLVEGLANFNSSSSFLDVLLSSEPSACMLSFLDETNQSFDIDSIMQKVFDDYQLDVEFGQSFPHDNGHFAI